MTYTARSGHLMISRVASIKEVSAVIFVRIIQAPCGRPNGGPILVPLKLLIWLHGRYAMHDVLILFLKANLLCWIVGLDYLKRILTSSASYALLYHRRGQVELLLYLVD